MLRTSEKFPGVEWIDTDQFINIDTTKCTGCANCIKVCIAECYEIKEKKARIKNFTTVWHAAPAGIPVLMMQ